MSFTRLLGLTVCRCLHVSCLCLVAVCQLFLYEYMDMNMEMYKISSVLNKIILQIIWLCFFVDTVYILPCTSDKFYQLIHPTFSYTGCSLNQCFAGDGSNMESMLAIRVSSCSSWHAMLQMSVSLTVKVLYLLLSNRIEDMRRIFRTRRPTNFKLGRLPEPRFAKVTILILLLRAAFSD